MKTDIHKNLALFFSISAMATLAADAARTFDVDNWRLTVEASDGAVSLTKDGRKLLDRSVARWSTDGNDTVSFADCKNIKVRISDGDGMLGKHKVVTINGTNGRTSATQRINLYADCDYVTTELELSSPEGVGSRYMAPVAVTDSYRLFDRTGNNIVFVPYDNDAWVRYSICLLYTSPSPRD